MTQKKAKRNISDPLHHYYDDNEEILEIGVDEAGRGPLFGRVYTAAVILPKDNSFDHTKMKDSKRFHSEKRITEVAEYIKQNAIKWNVTYEDERTIDKINIRQSTLQSMHNSIRPLLNSDNKYHLLIDGNDFKPFMIMKNNNLLQIKHTCFEGGDNRYTAIAAASILAKVERDEYIHNLCEANPDLKEKYNIENNKGYGTKKHLDGIKENGISKWHRKSYGICKEFS